MYKEVKRVHFVGIGGIGMSGIAEVLLSYGYFVSGSDLKKSALTERLKSLGAKVWYKHDKKNVSDSQVLVYSSAVSRSNPEIEEALRRKVPIVQRGEMLSEILRKGFSIAVSGAHGKTTTTAMIGKLIKSPKVNPTVIIGGKIRGVSRNAILGKGKVFVAEADESDGTFQKIRPNIAVVTNIDREHMDYYRDFERMEEAYLSFMNGVPFDGLVTGCGDDLRLKSIFPRLRKRIVTYGIGNDNDLTAENIMGKGLRVSFDVRFREKKLGRITLPIPGTHNALNALAACSVGLEMGISFKHMVKRLECFEGVERRMEIKGEILGATVVDDYAHHPTEIISTLDAARDIWDQRRFVVVFQPHRYSRLKDLLYHFPKAFKQADLVFVTDIYSAGEKNIENMNASLLVDLLKKNGKEVFYMHDWRENLEKVRRVLKEGDIIFSLGAGDINKFYDYFTKAI